MKCFIIKFKWPQALNALVLAGWGGCTAYLGSGKESLAIAFVLCTQLLVGVIVWKTSVNLRTLILGQVGTTLLVFSLLGVSDDLGRFWPDESHQKAASWINADIQRDDDFLIYTNDDNFALLLGQRYSHLRHRIRAMIPYSINWKISELANGDVNHATKLTTLFDGGVHSSIFLCELVEIEDFTGHYVVLKDDFRFWAGYPAGFWERSSSLARSGNKLDVRRGKRVEKVDVNALFTKIKKDPVLQVPCGSPKYSL